MKSTVVKVLKELSFPEYRARHIFTAKLRLLIFIGFWFLYVILLKDFLAETKLITILITLSFFVVTVCYYNIFNNRYMIPSFALEIIADLVSLTAIIYLTGGMESSYFVIYIFYAAAAGLFYNFRLALLVSVLSVASYGIFFALSYAGIIPPFLIDSRSFNSVTRNFEYLKPILLIIFLALTVYATKIAHYFTQIRERMLEARNKELLALQQMSSTIRTVAALDNVLAQVVSGVLEGLDLSMCLLMLYEKSEKKIRCIPPEMHPLVPEIEKAIGVKLKNIHISLDHLHDNEAVKQLKDGRIIFRRDISELISGITPAISSERFTDIQNKLGVKRVVAIPLVTSREVIGALIGFTTEAFVEAKKVHTFQAFADQAALVMEASLLISELRAKNIALMEANRVKSEFLATMSHELRTPLTAIIGFSELLLEGVMGTLSEEQEDSLKEVLGNANNLLEMINNLLDLVKVDSGKMELSRHSFDWKAMLQRVERSMAPLFHKKNHALHLDIQDELPTVFADEKRMQQIVLNLFSNAIKFTPDNGNITIKTVFYKSLESLEKDIDIKLDNIKRQEFEKGVYLCSVKDDGIGIAEDYLDTIFDVFQQADSSVTRSYEGTGLGLALVRQFVELHGGHVWVKSKENVGTTFSFIFPQV